MKQPLVNDRDVLVAEQIGARQSLTPEGFLYCEGVRIARTGPMLYAPFEIPDIEPGSNAMVVLDRDADVLFADECMASFNGKPVTNDHPDEMVTPETWKQTAVGIVLNTRRGVGVEAEYLLADLLITDAQAIADVQAGKREVSCGYESDREQVKPGLGRTTRVIGNHVALVDRGRCGPGCAILDKENTMAKRSVWDRLRTAFKAKDEAAFEEELKEAQDAADDEDDEDGKKTAADADESDDDKDDEKKTAADSAKILDALTGIADSLKALSDRVAKVEDRLAKDADGDDDDDDKKKVEDADGDDDEDKKPVEDGDDDDKDDDDKGAMDSVALRDEFLGVLSRAEILAPGVKLPAFDAKARAKSTVDAMCDLRRRAMAQALKDSVRKAHVLAVNGGVAPVLDGMPCATVAVLFNAASEVARLANNAGQTMDKDPVHKGPMTAARLAERIAARNAANPK